MRLHVVALPHTQTTQAFSSCAYTQKVVRFCKMMADNHEVFLYSNGENEAPCEEHINCGAAVVYDKLHYTSFPFETAHPVWKAFNERVIIEMAQRLEPRDYICLIAGVTQRTIADAFPNNMSVEFGIGYGGSFAKYRVFESYAWMHMTYGAQMGLHQADGRWYDTVIPNQVEIDLFPFEAKKDNYYLYVGRLIDRKGYRIAQEVCSHLKVPLILAGPGTGSGYGTFVGEVGIEKRGKLMSKAVALFAPSVYIEPFGTVAIEAMACGTPVISTDWGAFTETIIPGVTGSRCRTLQEFVDAADEVPAFDTERIRHHAVRRYSLEAVRPMYDRYFRQLDKLWNDGWYSLS